LAGSGSRLVTFRLYLLNMSVEKFLKFKSRLTNTDKR